MYSEINDTVLSFLEQHLASKTFFVGYSATLADIVVWSFLTSKFVFDKVVILILLFVWQRKTSHLMQNFQI